PSIQSFQSLFSPGPFSVLLPVWPCGTALPAAGLCGLPLSETSFFPLLPCEAPLPAVVSRFPSCLLPGGKIPPAPILPSSEALVPAVPAPLDQAPLHSPAGLISPYQIHFPGSGFLPVSLGNPRLPYLIPFLSRNRRLHCFLLSKPHKLPVSAGIPGDNPQGDTYGALPHKLS